VTAPARRAPDPGLRGAPFARPAAIRRAPDREHTP